MAFQRNSSSFRWRYDVFVSYTGTDSRDFKDHLINYLRHKGLAIFRDDESERGKSLSPLLDSAIECSKTYIVLFSENYANSEWCLDELVKILECSEMNHQLVLPVFYKVEPSVVRKQKGKFREAMDVYEDRFRDRPEKVTNWREALRTAASITGWEVGRDEAKFIEEITKEVSRRVANRAHLHEADHAVGLKPQVSELNSILEIGKDMNDVRVVVVFGPEGIGKTTIAKAAYNKNAYQFEGSSFLANVSENSKQPLHLGVLQMQKTLLSEILRDQTHMEVGNVYKGITLIKERLGKRRVLLVLDDVNSLDDLRSLAHKSDWFGKGSRIIVTTRDKNLLKFRDFPFVSTYEVKRLDDPEALKLFCWNAFGNESVRDGFVKLADQAVGYAEGFPLKLIELGSCLCERSIDEWDIELEGYRRNHTKKDMGENIFSFDENGNQYSGGFQTDKIQKDNLDSYFPSSTMDSLSIGNYANEHDMSMESENMIISRDGNGKICCLLSARQLSITWSDHSEYWSWISLPHSRFCKVAKLIEVYYFNIKGKIQREKLSSRTTYAVYFVFKFEESPCGFKERAVKLVASSKGSEGGGEHSAFLDPPRNAPQLCQIREDGWMEIKMGEFFINDGDHGAINCRLMEHDTSVRKTGLVVGGIEFRPKSMEHNRLTSNKRIPRDGNGKICFMLPARKLTIEWGEDSTYWRWISKPESRFSQVAKLHKVYFFDIKGEIESKILASRTMYVVYFVFKFEDGPVVGFKERAIQFSVNCGRGKVKSSAFLDPPENAPKLCREREDGWREIMMGEFCINDEDDGKIKCHLMEHDTSVKKKGLIVEGIEFRPKVY